MQTHGKAKKSVYMKYIAQEQITDLGFYGNFMEKD